MYIFVYFSYIERYTSNVQKSYFNELFFKTIVDSIYRYIISIVKIPSFIIIDHPCNFSSNFSNWKNYRHLFDSLSHVHSIGVYSWAVVHDISTTFVGSSLISANYRLSTRVTRIFQFSCCNSIPQLSFPLPEYEISATQAVPLPFLFHGNTRCQVQGRLFVPLGLIREAKAISYLCLCEPCLPPPCRGCRKRIQVDRYGRRRGTQGVISIAGIIEPWGALNEPSPSSPSSFSSSTLCFSFSFLFFLIIRCWSKHQLATTRNYRRFIET